MKRLVSSLLIVAIAAGSIPAWADGTTASAVPVSAPTVAPLASAQPAPFSGVLFSPAAVAQVIAQQDTAAAAQNLAVQHQQELDAAQQKFQLDTQATTCTADKGVLQAQLTDAQKQYDAINQQLKKMNSGPGAGVWIGIGVVGGIGVTLLTAFAIGKVTK